MRWRDLIPAWIRRIFTQPVVELNRWQYALRYFAEVVRHGAEQLQKDRASEMAAALAFRTIFGLVPVVIIAIVLFRAVGGRELLTEFIGEVLVSLRLDQVEVPVDIIGAQIGSDSPAPVDETLETITLSKWLTDFIIGIDQKIDFRSVGVVGLFVLGWAAISLLTTVEQAFNTICQTPEHRPLSRRVPLYWMTITLGPGLLYLSFFLGTRFDHLIEERVGAAAADVISLVTSFASVWIFFLLLYMFMPNTRLRLEAVAAGSFVSSILWIASANLMSVYLGAAFSRSQNYSALYGYLGLLPVFLLWVYFMWLIVLFGLELTATLQFVGGRIGTEAPSKPDPSPVVEPAAILAVVQVISDRFRDGKTTTLGDIVELVRLPERTVEIFVHALCRKNLLHRVDDSAVENAYVLAKPADRIPAAELLAIGHEAAPAPAPERSAVAHLFNRIRAAELSAAGATTLADLEGHDGLDAPPPPASPVSDTHPADAKPLHKGAALPEPR